jgi:hypothetical protein
MGPTAKYRSSAKDPSTGGPVTWNVHPEGLPVRFGDSPPMIEDRLMDHASAYVDFKSKVLRIPDDIEEYTKIYDWHYNQVAVVTKEVVREDRDNPGCWIVWLSWCDIRGFIPTKPQSGA